MKMICDPSELWVKHNIRWLDKGKRGAGWYKFKQVGKASFFVKLTQKECPICGRSLNPGLALEAVGYTFHPRPDEWLAAEDKQHRDDGFRARDAERVLETMGEEEHT